MTLRQKSNVRFWLCIGCAVINGALYEFGPVEQQDFSIFAFSICALSAGLVLISETL